MGSQVAIYDSDASRELPLGRLLSLYASLGVSRLIYKKLASNDNSKNQPYMAGHLTDLGFLPTGKIISSDSTSGKTRDPKRQIKYTTPLNLYWLSSEANVYRAPNAKLIYYPQFPEVRFSGFVTKCEFDMGGWMDPAKKGRYQGRVLFLGIGGAGEIYAYLATPESRIAREVDDYVSTVLTGVLRELPIKRYLLSRAVEVNQGELFDDGDVRGQSNIAETAKTYSVTLQVEARRGSAKDCLLDELRRIHLKHWIPSKRLNKNGVEIPYAAPNGGGYTLEAELGVIPNGIAEPDFLGWEVKQFGVKRFDLINSKALTVMTPEPNGGVYVDRGVEAFIREYGYADIKGRDNRFNFNGRHTANVLCEKTGLTLVTDGFDAESQMITNGAGSIALTDRAGNIASAWSFTKIMEHWKKKHSKAVYIPSISRKNDSGGRVYQYGNEIRLFEGTSIILLLKAVSDGYVYYDPGIKLENADTKPVTKRRSQFRIKSSALGHLYDHQEFTNVLK